MQFNQVKYQDAATKTYLGSPSFVRLPQGDLLATHDYFGPGCPLNHEREEHLSSVYRSSDDGASWTNVTHIAGGYWGNLFLHDGSIYHLGVSQQYGSIVIRRSDDRGNTWTHPADAKSGLLFRGGPFREPPNYHCAPMPVVHKDGRLYRAFEDCTPCVWGSGFQSLVISVPADADLLDAANWTMSNKLAYDPAWTPQDWGPLPTPGWLEGNVVEAPNGELWNILRFNSKPVVEKAAVVKIHENGARISFDPATGFIDFPGGMSKFVIRRDPVTGLYLTLTNNNTDAAFPNQRNVLSLYVSTDLLHWTPKQTLLADDLPLAYAESMRLTGFQYVDWHFDGDDLLYLVRTAYDGAHNYHDSNRITFHKLAHFRQSLSQ
ncbi:MAG: exo-alpha-sialidase [Caldilineaceae bacterium]|nr:exo-alpha-sialidase [Caldilineaceae bacterium]